MTAPQRIGPYSIERLLGVGSFATVWLGYDPVLDGYVAIKVLAENWSHDLRVRERFRDEARLLRRLEHERLVRVHAVGELPDGRPYAVLGWANGGSLRDRLALAEISVPAALRLLGEICAGVSVLHRHGVVHRDLTPGNILFHSTPAPSGAESTGSPSGAEPTEVPPGAESAGATSGAERVLIADLGLAKALAAASGLTARAGTPGYMAPEQDDPGAVIDTRADVYGLGRLGIRLLAAAPGPDPPRSTGALRLRDGVPARVTAVLVRATAHRPADRYPDAAALHAALDRATDPVRQSSPVARRPYRMLLAGAAVAAVTVAGAEPGDTGAERDTYTAGPLTVTLPDGWSATGATWAGQYDADGEAEPALVMSPQPRSWAADPGVPGAFVGVSVSTAARTMPAGFLAERTHGDCTSAPVRTTRQAGVEWTVVTYRCDRDRPRIVESAGLHPARGALVYVQVVPPLDGGPDFVDGLLAGVRVR
ncbi:serine/threonine-protein kinase [Micromonospora zamorensis]|uniref:serine/threonine-protein kinase n=1 Tax=Micromonospora zamorensis TaxID=709883 RepID=UPI002E285F17|nr:serine/threonine-protein kinase [Micromonospora zamorensis]